MNKQNLLVSSVLFIMVLNSNTILARNSDYSGFGFFSSDLDSYSDDSNDEAMQRPVIIDDSTHINISANTQRAATAAPTVASPRLTNREKKTHFSKNDIYYGKNLCGNGEYTCIKIKKGDTWNNLFPDDYQRELVQRLNRTNRGIWGRSWILVPNDLSKDYLAYSPMPFTRETNNQKTIIVSQDKLAFGAYDENGKLVHWGPANPGKPGTRTIHGDNFQVYRKGGAGCWSKKYEARIPYCMFFHGGFALHGFNLPGYAASHGCVRLYNSDAKWLNKEFADFKTKVIVEK